MKSRRFLTFLIAVLSVGPALEGQTAQWSRTFQTNFADAAYATAVDSTGVYLAGETRGVLAGQQLSGTRDAYLRKYDHAGTEQWTRQFGITNERGVVAANGVAADATGVYVAGGTYTSFTRRYAANACFVRKYDANGNLQWTYESTTVDQTAVAVAVSAGAVYVAGSVSGALPGQTAAGSQDVFVRKFDTTGNVSWERQFGTSQFDTGYSVAADASGVYIVGFMGPGAALPGQSFFGSRDAFIIKFDHSGALQWSNQFGTANTDYAYAVTASASGVYVIGSTQGPLAPPTLPAFDYDTFVRKYNPSGQVEWTRQFGTIEREEGFGGVSDASGVWVAGYARGGFPNLPSYGGRGDAFLARYDTQGNQTSLTTLGSNGDDYAYGAALSGSDIYVAGYADTNSVPDNVMAGDSFVTKFTVAAAGGQKPVLMSIANAASNLLPGLPNAGVAQGSMFVIKGTNLGPAAIEIATAFPLLTTFGGTSIRVTVGGVSRDAYMYYSTAGQVAAILPSAIPPGTGTVTLTYQGTASDPLPITVVASTIGIFTVNQSGGGDAIATLGASFVGPLFAANPGDIVTFWGTGLGPVPFDESVAAQQSNMTNVAIEAWVAGKPAEVVFRGRNACCAGVDAIYVRIPQGVGGCMTPVVFKTGPYVSNTTSIPTALSGRVCTPTVPFVSSSDVQRTITNGSLTYGVVGLFRTNPYIGAELGVPVDGSTVSFLRAFPVPGGLGAVHWDIPHYGSCVLVAGGQFLGFYLGGEARLTGTPITITGPAGVRSYDPITAPVATLDFGGNFVRPGTFTISTPTGRDMGPLSGSILFRDPYLTWTNQSALSSINPSAGFTVTWTGGDPDGYVHIDGSATTSGSPAVGVFFRCTARVSDGSFTVPPYVTMALPRSNPSTAPVAPAAFPTSIWVIGISRPARLETSGIDWGLLTQWVNNARTVTITGP